MVGALNGSLGNTAVGYGAGGSLTTGDNNVLSDCNLVMKVIIFQQAVTVL